MKKIRGKKSKTSPFSDQTSTIWCGWYRMLCLAETGNAKVALPVDVLHFPARRVAVSALIAL